MPKFNCKPYENCKGEVRTRTFKASHTLNDLLICHFFLREIDLINNHEN